MHLAVSCQKNTTSFLQRKINHQKKKKKREKREENFTLIVNRIVEPDNKEKNFWGRASISEKKRVFLLIDVTHRMVTTLQCVLSV